MNHKQAMQDKVDEHISLFLAFYQRVDGQLSAYAIWALLKFIKYFGVDNSSLSLEQLAKVVGVQAKKLRILIAELERHEILKIDFPESGKRARVRHIQLKLTYADANLGESIQLNDWLAMKNKRQQGSIPLLKLIKILFIKSDLICISNSSTYFEMNDWMDYRSYLVLLRLLYGADSFGIVISCGILELERATGLSKQSIYRSLQQLKKNGFIRSQANGAIRNSFIHYESPIYALNLSHQFWGDAAIYSKFYILQYSQPHVFEVQKVASLFTLLDCNNDLLQHSVKKNSQVGFDVLKFKDRYLFRDPLCWMKAITVEGTGSYEVIQNQEVMKFVDHFLGLQELHPENSLAITFKLKPHENVLGSEIFSSSSELVKGVRLNGMYNRLGLFQCLLEQWCSRIYSQDKQIFLALRDANRITIDDASFDRLGCSDFLYPYQLNQDYLKTIEEDAGLKKAVNFRLKSEQSKVHQFLMALMDMIAYNQIYFYQQCLDKPSHSENKIEPNNQHLWMQLLSRQEKVKPFRILPRSFNQNTYSCICVLDESADEDEYFLSIFKNVDTWGIEENSEFPVQQIPKKIHPTLMELKNYGILHPSYTP